MKPVRLVALTGLSLIQTALLLAQPVVSNVVATQRSGGNREVEISYDLASGMEPITVSLLVSDDDGGTYSITPQTVSGDIGAGITNGTGRMIVWDLMTDFPESCWPNARFRVVAEESCGGGGGGEPLVLQITSDVPSDVHQNDAQTLTFTFEQPVTGFDASDVTLTGATPGNFSGSGSVYTMDILGQGGRIQVSVPSNVTSPAHASGDLSNFYQDTWTLILQGEVPMELIRIPAGTLDLGSPVWEESHQPDETVHEVTLSQDFYMSKTEVTRKQWEQFLPLPSGNDPDDFKPVRGMAWDDAQQWLISLEAAVNLTEPGVFSLPTEAQWEYACRAGSRTRFNFGDGLSADDDCATGDGREDNMWYCGNDSPSGSKDVGQKPPNAWGLHDMHGNVWEWCLDWYDSYQPGPITDPSGPTTGANRVVRGGSYLSGARDCRSSVRGSQPPASQLGDLGFRVVASKNIQLTISSSLGEGTVHQTPTQTLLFTFSAPVTGFDISDVAITNATAGTFLQSSGSIYSLEVTGTGGLVTATVPPGAATSLSGGTSTLGDTFSNFYQDTWTLNLPGSVPMEMIRVPAGTFMMGSPETELSRGTGEVLHQVTLTQDYYMGKTEVTIAQWNAFGVSPSLLEFPAANHPAHTMEWQDATDWMTLLQTHINQTEPGTFSLPTEAQWEHACRAGGTSRFSFGNGLHPLDDEDCGTTAERVDNMWYCGNEPAPADPDYPWAVAQKPANAWGLFDMHGNVAEYCQDWWGPYPTGPLVDPTGPPTYTLQPTGEPNSRVWRGGYFDGWASFARSAFRGAEYVPGSNALLLEISTSADLAGNVLITTTGPHLLQTGRTVEITGHSVSAVNGQWTVTVTSADGFTLDGSVYTSSGTGGTATDPLPPSQAFRHRGFRVAARR